MTPGTIDLILGLVLLFFVIKGYLTGFMRAVVSILAVVVAWVASGAMPNVTAPLIRGFIDPQAPEFHFVTHLTTWILAFVVVQVAGFVLTGLMEKIGLGAANKLAGAALGAATGVLIGCVPLVLILSVPAIGKMPDVQWTVHHSLFLRTYRPLVASFVHPAASPHHASRSLDS